MNIIIRRNKSTVITAICRVVYRRIGLVLMQESFSEIENIFEESTTAKKLGLS